jgi:hypothetical protein
VVLGIEAHTEAMLPHLAIIALDEKTRIDLRRFLTKVRSLELLVAANTARHLCGTFFVIVTQVLVSSMFGS